MRDDPADAEAINHKLLVRGGFVRQLMAGSWSLLPLGMKVTTKISNIIREEMNAIGGQEFLLPVVHPAEAWKKSGRWDDVEGILVKFKDRRDTDLLLAMTHEEIFTMLAAEMSSYRDLPQMWYHLQTKFRDEARPKSGLLRVREFTMKDSYSFDIDPAGLDVQFDRHREAYTRIFTRLGLPTVQVEASSGSMGGKESVEFMVRAGAGEDLIVVCTNRDYAANIERASSPVEHMADEPWEGEPERFPTPGIHTIAALAEVGEFAAAQRQIKTLVYVIGAQVTLVLLRGDHELQEQKLSDGAGGLEARPAREEEIVAALGTHPGSLGPIDVDLPIIADPALQGRVNMVTGANQDDWHLRGVDMARDVSVGEWLEVRTARAGNPCPNCDGSLEIEPAIEIGHIFKLGTRYSEKLSAYVMDEQGNERPVVMGSYGIGVGRSMAAVVEARNDEAGLIWPVSIAPYEVVITVLRQQDEAPKAAGEALYGELGAMGIDVILDDRDERPGVKFKDAELIGIPYRLTVGPRGLENGMIEVLERQSGDVSELAIDEAAEEIAGRVIAARPGP